jgi:hypothetical protein
VQRTFEIWSFVFKFVLKRVALNLKWTYWGKFSEATKKERLQRLAVWLREGLLRLGPTFIKIGQQVRQQAATGSVCASLPTSMSEALSPPIPPPPTSSPPVWTFCPRS